MAVPTDEQVKIKNFLDFFLAEWNAREIALPLDLSDPQGEMEAQRRFQYLYSELVDRVSALLTRILERVPSEEEIRFVSRRLRDFLESKGF